MATGQWTTIADLTSRMDGAGKQMYIAEMLAQSVVVFEDIPMVQGSEIGGHQFAYRTSIPTGQFRSANQGVPYGKSTTGKSQVGIGSLEGYSQVDRMLAEDSGNIEEFRTKEEAAYIEGMGQTMEKFVWYGNTTTNPLAFEGFSYYYNTVNQANAANAANVIDGLGTGNNNTSIWLSCWGERTIYGIYPRGSKAGLTTEDKGDTVPGFDALGNRFEAYTMWFRHQFGLVPENWTYAARIANIDVTSAGLAGPDPLDIFATLAELVMLPQTLGKLMSGITRVDAPIDPTPGIRPVLYTCRTGRHWMDVQAMRGRNVLLTLNDYDGRVVDTYRKIPIKVSDQLLITEARVV